MLKLISEAILPRSGAKIKKGKKLAAYLGAPLFHGVETFNNNA